MEAHHLRLRAKEHGKVLATDFACRSLGRRNRSQGLGIVVRLETLSHRLARLRLDPRFRPERVVDVQAAAALLPEPSNAAFRILCGKSPHTEANEATCVAERRGEGGGTEPTHWRLEDGPLEVESVGERVLGPHRCSPNGRRMAGFHFSNGRGYR